LAKIIPWLPKRRARGLATHRSIKSVPERVTRTREGGREGGREKGRVNGRGGREGDTVSMDGLDELVSMGSE
jgi:hypothetical protein